MTKEKQKSDETGKGSGQGPARTRKPTWRRRIFDQRWILDHTSYLLFLCMLAVGYIYNGHHSEKRIKDINRTAKELSDLEYEYKTLKSELMFREKQSEVVRAVAPAGLKQPSRPPYRLTDTLP
jgi:hypothetical protein